jgi:hypothetical protein
MPRNGTNSGNLAFLRGMTRPSSTDPSKPDDPISSTHDTEQVTPWGTLDRILLRPEQTGPAVFYILGPTRDNSVGGDTVPCVGMNGRRVRSAPA